MADFGAHQLGEFVDLPGQRARPAAHPPGRYPRHPVDVGDGADDPDAAQQAERQPVRGVGEEDDGRQVEALRGLALVQCAQRLRDGFDAPRAGPADDTIRRGSPFAGSGQRATVLDVTLAAYKVGMDAVIEVGGVPQSNDALGYVAAIRAQFAKYAGIAAPPDGATPGVTPSPDESGDEGTPAP
ncbi:hypothetical protein SHIRM173S_03703 [Streptomyces hirsutus]